MNATLEMPARSASTKPDPDTNRMAVKPAKEKILLVDDDPGIRRILLRLLAEDGYRVLTASNGVEALERAEATKFDLVLLDLNMPRKDGWETFEQLTAKNPLLPVILITARPNQIFPAMASGVGALLEKPLDFVKLFAMIENLLEEPAQVRLGRLTGQTSAFRYIPPIPDNPEKKAD